MDKFIISDFVISKLEHQITNRLMYRLNLEPITYTLRSYKRNGAMCAVYNIDEVVKKLENYLETSRIKSSQNYSMAKVLLQRINNDK